MYARTTTIHGNPQALDEGIRFCRDEVMPMVTRMDGCVGLSMLVDRESGDCIVTTAWRDEAAMHASAESVQASRQKAGEILGGQPSVQEWEVAVLHRHHEVPEGACARVTYVQCDPARVDGILDAYKMSLLPRLEELTGFCSASLMMSRNEGRGAGTVTFENRQAMEGSREQARMLRDDFAPRVGVAITDVREYEMALAHLRVPETV